MAFNLENMTVDYKKLYRVVPTDRAKLAQSGTINDLIGSLTPGQLANLFPKYYRDRLPDTGLSSVSGGGVLSGALSGGTRISGGTGGSTYNPIPAKSPSVEEKAVQELFEKAGLNQVGSGATSGLTDIKGRVISTASINISPQERALLDTIAMGDAISGADYWESPDYNTIVGSGGKFEDFSDHPRVFGTAASTAAGRYQFTKTTWDDVVTRYNKRNPEDKIEDFSPVNQDKAALFLARERYKANTGRDLDADLANPPAEFGELIKAGLGHAGGNSYLTWEIFVKKNADEIGSAFASNYDRNIGYVEEIEKSADQIKGLDTVITKFDPSMISQLDQRLQNWYNNASDIQKKKFEQALTKLGTSQFNETMKNQPVNTPTLQAVSNLSSGESRVSEEQAGYRSSPIKPELKNALEYAAEQSGLYVKVFSGGQTEEQQAALTAYRLSRGQKPPADRHDVENPDIPGAADVNLAYKDTNGNEVILDQSNPDHWPMIAEFTKNHARVTEGAGVGGWSPNDPYMGKTAFHFGGPNKKGGAALAYQGMDYLKQAHAEGVALREQDKKNNYDPLNEWIAKKNEERKKAIENEAEALRGADPVSAAQANMEVPSLASGGTVGMTPGENIAGINTNTGQVEFMSNDRELYTKDDKGNLRIDPSTIRQDEPSLQPASTQNMEAPTQPLHRRPEVPVPQENPDPNFVDIMTSGSMASSPSQLRALNRARLYSENSSNLINGHFS